MLGGLAVGKFGALNIVAISGATTFVAGVLPYLALTIYIPDRLLNSRNRLAFFVGCSVVSGAISTMSNFICYGHITGIGIPRVFLYSLMNHSVISFMLFGTIIFTHSLELNLKRFNKMRMGFKRAKIPRLALAISPYLLVIGIGSIKSLFNLGFTEMRLFFIIPIYATTITLVGSLGLSVLLAEIWILEMIATYVKTQNVLTTMDEIFWINRYLNS